MEIEQRYVISFLMRRGTKTQEIFEILKETYEEQAYSIESIRYWKRQIKINRKNLHEFPMIEKQKDQEITSLVKQEMDSDPFQSARKIAKTLNISPNTVIDRLRNDLGYENYNTRTIPHQLTSEQKNRRVSISKAMLQILTNKSRKDFSNIITGDESWFIYEYIQPTQWVLSKDNLLEKVKKTNFQKKKMVTIFFNGKGVVFVDFLPLDTSFNSERFIYIIDNIWMKVCPDGMKSQRYKNYLHYDNSRCHTSKKVEMYLENSKFEKMPHPPYSPDIAPCDFGLFGTIKTKLEQYEYQEEEELESIVRKILREFPDNFWTSLFEEWKRRLNEVITQKGNYLS